jgi:hypothetical protein
MNSSILNNKFCENVNLYYYDSLRDKLSTKGNNKRQAQITFKLGEGLRRLDHFKIILDDMLKKLELEKL